MIFNSLSYLCFLSVIYLFYILINAKYKRILLLISSFVFYGFWSLSFLLILLISSGINYYCALKINGSFSITNKRVLFYLVLLFSCSLMAVIQQNYILNNFQLLIPNNLYSFCKVFLNREIIILGLFCGALITCFLIINRFYSKKNNPAIFFYIGIIANLLILGFFKYFNFFLNNIVSVLKWFNLDLNRFQLEIILPVGISFYTFRGISYLIDVYKNKAEAERDYVNISLYFAFFPSILAGPIDRVKSFLSQLEITRKSKESLIYEGLHLIFYGLFKKVVIADGIVRTVNSVFESSGQPSWADIIIACVLFSIQIYCDFSGYTDMARGSAKLFGIDLMINFNLPYFSKSIREFWYRWHISLSSWLRDYLYIPLGGNKIGSLNTYRNLMLTMVLGGFWHGADWNFILWGFYHGCILSLNRFSSRFKTRELKRFLFLKNGIKIIITLLAIIYGWMLFRATSVDTIINFSKTIFFGYGDLSISAIRPKLSSTFGIFLLLIIEIAEYFNAGKVFYKSLKRPVWTGIYSLIIFSFLLSLGNESAQFIYFNF